MLKIKQVAMVDSFDWDALVTKTYDRPYCFQQQNGCQPRGTHILTVPADDNDFENDTLPEKINGDEQLLDLIRYGVRFSESSDCFEMFV